MYSKQLGKEVHFVLWSFLIDFIGFIPFFSSEQNLRFEFETSFIRPIFYQIKGLFIIVKTVIAIRSFECKITFNFLRFHDILFTAEFGGLGFGYASHELCFTLVRLGVQDRKLSVEYVNLSFLKGFYAFTKFFHFDECNWFTFECINIILATFRM